MVRLASGVSFRIGLIDILYPTKRSVLSLGYSYCLNLEFRVDVSICEYLNNILENLHMVSDIINNDLC